MSYNQLTKTNEIYTVYLTETNDIGDYVDHEALNIEHSPENGQIRIDIFLQRWRTCDEMASYLEWVTDQILKFKDLKGK
jgi:hypothetical protein